MPGSAVPQHRFGASGFVSLLEHRADVGSGLERSSGLVFGAAASARLGTLLELAVRARGGSLGASTFGAVDRNIGEISFAATVAAASWLALQAEASRRVYSSDIARQGWTLLGLGAAARIPFAERALRGVARLGLLPLVSVAGRRPDAAFTAAVGLEYEIGGITFGTHYSLERCDFPPRDAARRREQLSALTLQLSLGTARPR